AGRQRPERGEIVGVDQRVDKLVSLVRILVSKEGLRLFDGRQPAGRVKIRAPQKLLVGTQIAGKNLHLFEFGVDESVDEVILGSVVPGEAGDVFEEGDVRRGHLVEIPRQN